MHSDGDARKGQRRPGAAAAILLASLLAACTNNDIAIFYFIENEKKVVDSSLSNEASIVGMGKATGRYFVSLGVSLWTRLDTESDWNKVKLPSDTDLVGPLVVANIGVSPERVYVGLHADGRWGLWSGTIASSPAWTRISGTPFDGRQVTGLWVTGPALSQLLFACVQNSETSYTLYYSSDGSTFASTGLATGLPVTQVTYDDTGSTYYAAAGSKLYSGLANALTTDITPSEAEGLAIGGVYYSTTLSRLYVATGEEPGADEGGRLLQSDDGGSSWSRTGEISASGEGVRFTRIGEVSGRVMIGTKEHGLYYLDAAGSVSSYSRISDDTDTELYAGTVLDFFADPDTPGLVFALTAGSGLWRSTWAGTAFADWDRE